MPASEVLMPFDFVAAAGGTPGLKRRRLAVTGVARIDPKVRRAARPRMRLTNALPRHRADGGECGFQPLNNRAPVLAHRCRSSA